MYPNLLTSLKWKNILVLTPHADDETLGCAGFLLSAVKQGKNIKVTLYSDNSESVINDDVNTIVEMRSKEFNEAMRTIGIENYFELKNYSVKF